MLRLIVAVFILGSFSSTFACDRGENALLCNDDTVVSKHGTVGVVIGVNPRASSAAVNWHTSFDGYSIDSRSTDKVKKFSIGRGCLDYYCVGDKVISEHGTVGKIIGVNPYSSSAAVNWHTSFDGYSIDSRSTVNIKKLSIGRGCVEGVCVGDNVTSSYGTEGRVLGVNPYQSKAAVRWEISPNGYEVDNRSTISMRKLFVEKFCEEYGRKRRSFHVSINLMGKIEIGKFKYRFAIDL